MKTKFFLAPSESDLDLFCTEKSLPKARYVLLVSWDQIKNKKNPEIILYGRWWEVPFVKLMDFNEACKTLGARIIKK